MIATRDHDRTLKFRRGLAPRRETTAVSSRGLGHSPLKAGTRVRIPLPLLKVLLLDTQDVDSGSIVYRLGHDPFKVERRVRFPLELSAPSGAG